ncbi:DoxX family membrane protein [Myxococcus fulvus]|uniref:DoxX family membrane protein n=1 Tax=Myxococcus fulvus TaxID=33 RepID=UPI003B9CC80E
MTTAAPISSAPEPVAPVAPIVAPEAPPPAAWSLAKRLGFRFVCAFILISCFAFPLDALPVIGAPINTAISDFWAIVVRWVARNVAGYPGELLTNQTGSGDRALDYAQMTLFLGLALVATAVWSLVDRRRLRYDKAHALLHVYVRYLLAVPMLGYGFSKVFKSQFPTPSVERLTQSLGDFSPMGLLWTFMGHSPGYNIFTGGAEVLGGLLLLTRRTTTLGALVVIGVMANVVALNFFYDVPVKLYSTQLLLFAVLLALPDLRRLANVFVLNRATQPASLELPFPLPTRVLWATRAAKALFIGWLLYNGVTRGYERYTQWGDGAPPPLFTGLYQVESFTRDGQELPPLLTDPHRWRAVTVSRYAVAARMMNDVRRYFPMKKGEDGKSVLLMSSWDDDAKPVATLRREKPDAEHFVIQGEVDGVKVDVRLKQVDTSKLELRGRGFNWVQEKPYNR